MPTTRDTGYISAYPVVIAYTQATAGMQTQFLVIGGGGGGGGGLSGDRGNGGGGSGGGAGGYRCSVTGETSGRGSTAEEPLYLPKGTYTVVVGAGGAIGGQGQDSSISTIISRGGGAGLTGNSSGGSFGSTGGAGAGGGLYGGLGISGQGYDGGTYVSDARAGGGGGGAGAVGGNAPSNILSGGVGGNGLSSSINGTPTTRGGGGAGAGYNSSTQASGGTGGGGDGGGSPVEGTVNTGGGGGAGSGANNGYTRGKKGGSGLVIIRYLTTDASDAGFTISGGTATTSGLYNVRTFTSSGSLVIS